MILPKVSIQIPTYNQAALLDRAIQSCLTQDYRNIEVIIADDCSPDNTREVAAKYLSDPRVRYFRNETNTGRVKNYRKSLFEYATGDWLLNVDGDDYLTNKRFISSSIDKILAAGDVLFLQGAHRIIESGKAEKIVGHAFFKNDEVINAQEYFLNFFRNKHFSHLSTLFNRNCMLAADFYNKDVISADIYSTLKACIMFHQMKVLLTNDVSGNWILADQNASKNISLGDQLRNTMLYMDLFKEYTARFGYKGMFAWIAKASMITTLVYIKRRLISLIPIR